ncbi:MAG TPA: MraY family glycosyltransferase [Actinomycetota bacterium]|nr:MraY family glycosyltransferase [Actinomycetota bacterium]
MLDYVAVFAAAAGAALIGTPLVRRLAVRNGFIDHPSDRKVHPKPTPTLGGLALWFAVIAGLGVAYAIPDFRPLFEASSEPIGVAVAGTVIVALGGYDDVRTLSVPAKVAGQILAAGILLLFGVQLAYFWFPGLGVLSLSADLALPLTLLWVLAMVNAVNLIDGLDGLAAGVVAIAAAAFFVYAQQAGQPIWGDSPSPASLLCVVVAGAALGFLPYNLHPARIFMGDSGSMLLGLVLGAATISGVGKTDAPTNSDLAALAIPVAIPLLVLAVPFTDVAFAIVRRVRRGRPVTRPDKEHIHHQLLEIGHSHRTAVLLMYLWSALLAGSALVIYYVRSRFLAVTLLIAVALVLVGTSLPRMLRNGRTLRAARRRHPSVTSPDGEEPAKGAPRALRGL